MQYIQELGTILESLSNSALPLGIRGAELESSSGPSSLVSTNTQEHHFKEAKKAAATL